MVGVSMIVLFDLPTAASSSKASAFGDEATGEQNGTGGSESVLLGSCLGQKDPQWSVVGVRLTRPDRGFFALLSFLLTYSQIGLANGTRLGRFPIRFSLRFARLRPAGKT